MVVIGGGAITPSTDTAVSINSSDWDETGSVPNVWFVSMNNANPTTDTSFIVDAICVQATSVGGPDSNQRAQSKQSSSGSALRQVREGRRV